MANNSKLAPGWRTSHANNSATTDMAVADLGDPSWRARPRPTASVVTPPATTGTPGWRPSRAGS
ncbi:hypothetical protein [Mycolicibacterium sp. CR10]|uniref:hypothetical protein n=1 Tax=Mycolicibacterium sp. CR10 TaxID=2562314 RepID=UPI0010C09344|nr:hypothetical protein [Mycolicibacterium sp. CR10]